MTGQDKYNCLMSKYKQLQSDHKKVTDSQKKKMQFSQKICIFSCVFVILIWSANFVLLWFGKEQMSDVISIGFTIFGGFVTGGYFALSGVRDCSKNKHAKEIMEAEREEENQ